MIKLFFFLSILSILSCSNSNNKDTETFLKQASDTSSPVDLASNYELDIVRLKQKAKEALDYSKNHSMNTNYCILIDMDIHSGRNRMFLWDFKADKIKIQGLSSHGCGDKSWGIDETKTTPVFSNVSDSHLSSLGKFKIGKRGWSNWGIHVNYKLHGLEKSNSNAYKRVIVLHSWEAVSSEETFPTGTPEGWGCPALNNTVMKKIDTVLKEEGKPLLLWIYK